MKACRDCHFITEGESCPSCRGTNLSKDWAGYVVVIDAKRSVLAKKMNIDAPGKYALKVR
ncbi:MAG: DNA-directed RNA polymerase, subunit E'' [Euryarchaeota archaeon]|nr:DNA-directed RNA polymerase, subunit E'' [Euryarchaeota archaeon]